jgi:hypothetical protein
MVSEEHVEQIPVQVCKQVAVQETVRTPRVVCKRVPVTYSYRVPRCVERRELVETCASGCSPLTVSSPIYTVPSSPTPAVPAPPYYNGDRSSNPSPTYAPPRESQPNGTTNGQTNGQANGQTNGDAEKQPEINPSENVPEANNRQSEPNDKPAPPVRPGPKDDSGDTSA